jgi:hypothetical protein
MKSTVNGKAKKPKLRRERKNKEFVPIRKDGGTPLFLLIGASSPKYGGGLFE